MCGCFSIARACLQYEDFVTFSVPPSSDISLLLHLDATGMHSIRTVCNASLPSLPEPPNTSLLLLSFSLLLFDRSQGFCDLATY
nr:hypothetical protein CFP56_42448 [Quercus suber]